MMKKKTICFILTLLLIVCGALGGCKKNNGPVDGETDNPPLPTGSYIVSEAKSDYKIVTRSDMSARENLAVAELQKLFKEGTGITLPIIYADDISYFSENDKYIFIGDSKFAEECGINAKPEELTRSGYVLKTVGKSVFITGASDVATIFGVYKFLEYILDYDYYYIDYYALDRNADEIPLYNFNIKFRPDYEYNSLGAGYFSDGMFYAYSMTSLPVAPINNTTGHNSIYWLPTETFNNPDDPDNYHPDWYMEAAGQEQTQLCYTAHGNAQEFDAMAAEMAHQVAEEMIADENSYAFYCTISDDFNWCECAACKSSMEKYGVKSASVIRLLNAVSKKVDAWLKTDEGKPYAREWTVTFYAYNDLTAPPVNYDSATDTFTTVDDSVFCDRHVIPQIADILSCDYTAEYEADVNSDTRLMYRGWGYLSDRLAAYLYSADYDHFMHPFDNISVLQSWYKALKGNYRMFLNGHTHETGFATGWSALRVYLMSKLGNDVDVNVEEYTDKFFRNVYLDAAEPMKTLYNEWRAHSAYWKENDWRMGGKMCHYSRGRFLNSKFYSVSLLERWRSYIDDALNAIEYLKDNETLYKQVSKMIIGERVFINYLYYEIYKFDVVYMPMDKRAEIKEQLISDIRYAGVSATKEGTDSSTEYYINQIKGE